MTKTVIKEENPLHDRKDPYVSDATTPGNLPAGPKTITSPKPVSVPPAVPDKK